MDRVVDLRSDTVTQPTPAMREAMARAEVGDDVFGEDPTVNRLEALAARLMGKEAALFVTSGTMGNLVGVLSHCQRGDEVIVGAGAHVFWYEVAGLASVGGLQLRTVPDDEGAPTPESIVAAVRPANIHFPRTAALCLENTHNRHGGIVTALDRTRGIAAAARAAGLAIHLDGARLFNAAIALGLPARALAVEADSVSFCLSKGLCAPVGSLLCGRADYIARARKLRKMLGGGMRQAGILAAAGIVAIQQMIERLAEDHDNAALLARGLSRLPGISLDLARVQTNIVVLRVVAPGVTAEQLIAALASRGVKVSHMGGDQVRLVTHYGIGAEDLHMAVAAFENALA